MSVRRLIGMETEYGIHAPQNPRASHVALSIELVNAYAAAVTFTLAVRPGGLDELQAMLAALSQGEISAREAGSAWVEVGSGS